MRAALLASTALLLAAAAPARALEARQDLGVAESSVPVSATIWLQPHDSARFEAEIAARMTPGSPKYHQWMTPAEAASYEATEADIAKLTASLRAEGLRVTATEGDRTALHVTGSAAAIGAAFGTELHQYEESGRRFYAAAAEPSFRGAHAELIAGITGLSGVRMIPHLLRATNLATGKPRAGIPLRTNGTVTNPGALFTDKCFVNSDTLSFYNPPLPPVGAVSTTITGPGYVADGDTEAALCAYTPAEVAAHYGLPAVYAKGWKGQGQTIVLVDAYGSPTIESDANTFSTIMGLPALSAKNFKVVYPDGLTDVSPYATGWPGEISLDVEWAHAMAPDANIVLVIAPSDDDLSMAAALQYAVAHKLGQVISNSYGYAEAGTGTAAAKAFNQIIMRAAAQGIAVNVSTGDSGDYGLGTPKGAASIPADSPWATGVGGTSIDLPSDNGPVDAVWGITDSVLVNLDGISTPPIVVGFQQGGGGGESGVFAKPKWQAKAGIPGTGRQLPDVSAIADPQTGVIIVDPNGDGTASELDIIGGTSLSSPVFSGIWALADQAAGHKLGQAAPIIAKMTGDAVTDIVPIVAKKTNLASTVTISGVATRYDAAELLGLQTTQPTGFVSATINLTVSFLGGPAVPFVYDFGFGVDSSLMTAKGWDDATGFGSPNGLAFVKAAKAAR